jgi:hypothetical protein
MRTSNRGARFVVAAVGLIVSLAGCGGSSATPSTSTAATPVITPDPHLREPVSVDNLYRLIGGAGIRIVPTTASKGPNGEPVKRIIGTYDDWPIVLSEYSSTGKLRSEAKFNPKNPPKRGEAPYIIEGLNILIEFGPRITNDRSPAPPPSGKREAIAELVTVLDPLVGPLRQRSVVPVPLSAAAPVAPPPASAAPSPSKPSS